MYQKLDFLLSSKSPLNQDKSAPSPSLFPLPRKKNQITGRRREEEKKKEKWGFFQYLLRKYCTTHTVRVLVLTRTMRTLPMVRKTYGGVRAEKYPGPIFFYYSKLKRWANKENKLVGNVIFMLTFSTYRYYVFVITFIYCLMSQYSIIGMSNLTRFTYWQPFSISLFYFFLKIATARTLQSLKITPSAIGSSIFMFQSENSSSSSSVAT